MSAPNFTNSQGEDIEREFWISASRRRIFNFLEVSVARHASSSFLRPYTTWVVMVRAHMRSYNTHAMVCERSLLCVKTA